MPSAFWQLLLRPINLFALFILFWAVIGPALVIDSALGNRVLDDLRTGAPSTAMLHYALILGITLPAAFGFIAATASLELQFTRMSWTLPAVPRRLTTGMVAFGLPAVAIVAWLTARASTPALGLTAFALGSFWFCALLPIPDAAASPAMKWLLAGALIAGLLRPELYVAMVIAHPITTAVAATLVGIALLRHHTSPRVRRRRMDVASSFQSGTVRTRLFWQHFAGAERSWTRPMAGAAPLAWVNAALFEMMGAVRNGWGGLVAGYAIIGAIAYVVSPGVLLVMGFNLAFTGIQLRGGLLYPLSREQRGCALFIGNFLDVVLLVAVAGTSAGMLAVLDAPRVHDAASAAPYELAMVVALLFAVAPIAQWARVRKPLAPDAKQQLGRHVLFPIVAWAVTVFVMMRLLDATAASPAGPFTFIAILVVAVQSLHYLGIRRVYATRDLV